MELNLLDLAYDRAIRISNAQFVTVDGYVIPSETISPWLLAGVILNLGDNVYGFDDMNRTLYEWSQPLRGRKWPNAVVSDAT